MKRIISLMLLFCFFPVGVLLSQENIENSNQFTKFPGAYLGQIPPSTVPKIFAPEIVSTKEFFEFTNTFTPDGKEFYFTRRISNKDVIMVTSWKDKTWTEAETAPFFKKFPGFEQFVSLDGKKMFFNRFAPPPGGLSNDKNLSPADMEAQMVNIWVMDRINKEWSKPEYCVNGMYVTVSQNGTIYTTDIRETSNGVCRYKLIDGKYGEREFLIGVNSPVPGAHPCIAPDESFIIFDSKRGDNPKNDDLFICFRKKDGSWSEALNLGEKINTANVEMCAVLSPDAKYLFYHSKGDIYWVSTDFIEKLKPKEL